MNQYRIIAATILLIFGLHLQTAQADTIRAFDATSSPSDLAQFLFPEIKNKTRGIKNQPAQNVAAMRIEFRFDSARLTSKAALEIAVMAEALTQPQAINGRLLIEGHTDSIGTEEYNLQLSERRAEAVRHQLVYEHGISAERLLIRGKGESELLNPLAPTHGLNRRVQFMEIL